WWRCGSRIPMASRSCWSRCPPITRCAATRDDLEVKAGKRSGPAWRMAAVAGGSGFATGADDAGLVGEDHDLHAVAQAELGQGVGDVALDGCLAEVEPGCDLGVGHALGYQPDDVEFALAEAPGCAAGRGGR